MIRINPSRNMSYYHLSLNKKKQSAGFSVSYTTGILKKAVIKWYESMMYFLVKISNTAGYAQRSIIPKTLTYHDCISYYSYFQVIKRWEISFIIRNGNNWWYVCISKFTDFKFSDSFAWKVVFYVNHELIYEN